MQSKTKFFAFELHIPLTYNTAKYVFSMSVATAITVFFLCVAIKIAAFIYL